MQFKNIFDIQKFIESFPPAGKKSNLDRIRALCSALGDPQNFYKTIHIAGSKGKGSVAAYISNALSATGRKTGLYMSPHVVDFRERFTLSGVFFSDTEMLQTAEEFCTGLNRINLTALKPSVFEIYTAFAFLLFKNTGCEWVVLETGLGGRLDATNITRPVCSVLTPIELEHTNILGNTIAEIALEKAQIIKQNTPVFISVQEKDAENVFTAVAKERNAPVYFVKDHIKHLTSSIKNVSDSEKQHVSLVFRNGEHYLYNLSMLGFIQAQNSALSLLALKETGILSDETKDSVIKGIESAYLPARMQRINCFHSYYIDGAHTENSIKNAVKTIKSIHPVSAKYCVFGCIADKDYKKMCDILLKNFNTIIVSKPNNYKKSNPIEIYDYLQKHSHIRKKYLTGKQEIFLIEKPEDVISFFGKLKTKPVPILVCGSFYLADEFINALNK